MAQKVDAHAWVAAVSRSPCSIGGRSSFWWLWSRSYLARALRIGCVDQSNWNRRQRRTREGSEARKKITALHNWISFGGDARAMEFRSDRFDLVYSRMLLEYLKDKEGAVARNDQSLQARWHGFAARTCDGQLLWALPGKIRWCKARLVKRVVKALGCDRIRSIRRKENFLRLARNAGLKKN